jgi:N-acetylneuraminic acid mutarotase
VFPAARALPLGVMLVLSVCAGCDGETSTGVAGPDALGPAPDGGALPGGPPSPGRWESGPSMPGTPRYYVGVTAVGKRVFVVGGFGSGPQAQEVAAYDTGAGTWEQLPPLPRPMQMPNVAAVDGKLYVLGALDQTAVFSYDEAGRTWVSGPAVPVNRGRGQSAVGVWGKKILIAGGVIPGQSANGLNTGMRQHEVLAFDTASATWEALPDLSLTRGYCMGAVVDDQFWVMGGSSDFARTDDVTVLDLQTRTWMDKPQLPISLSSAGVAVYNGRVYLVGGVATSSGTIGPATLVLDPRRDVFDDAAVMITPRFGMGAAAVDGRIYVPGGIAASDVNMFKPVATLEVFIP